MVGISNTYANPMETPRAADPLIARARVEFKVHSHLNVRGKIDNLLFPRVMVIGHFRVKRHFQVHL
jgi:hypothetical protein